MKNLEILAHAELKGLWLEYFKAEPPSGASKEFLIGHITWMEQADKHGGLKRSSVRQLKTLTQQLRMGVDLTPEHVLTVKTGTRLIREYQGEKHEVIVVEKGFRYRDQSFGSLSAIARHITGTNWNGKVFFGVRS